jgi:hypothetical protein
MGLGYVNNICIYISFQTSCCDRCLFHDERVHIFLYSSDTVSVGFLSFGINEVIGDSEQIYKLNLRFHKRPLTYLLK